MSQQRQSQRATTPKASGISGKPRRMSQSPSKRPERAPFEHPSLAAALQNTDANPFQKKGLRRSPPAGSQQSQPSQPEPMLEDTFANPFKKTGLRRSPISSQPTLNQEQTASQPKPQIETRNEGLRRSPIARQQMMSFEQAMSNHEATPQIRRSALRRSPIGSVLTARIETDEILQETIRQPDFGPRSVSRRVLERVSEQFPEQLPEHQRDPAPKKNSLVDVEAQLDNHEGNTPKASAKEPEELPPVSTTPTEPVPPRQAARNESPEDSPEIDEPPEVDELPDTIERPAQRAAAQILGEFPTPVIPSLRSPLRAELSAADLAAARLLNPFLPRSQEEPQLPPTPTQRGIPDPVVTTPPIGIHDTPSKTKRKLAEKLKSSPLKPKDARPEQPKKKLPADAEIESQSGKTVAPEVPAQRRKSARFIELVDPHAAKKKERDDLLQQLQQLKADVALANQENERMRLLLESKKKPAPIMDTEELLAMLLRSTAKPVVELKPVSIMQSVDAFLPFGRRRKPIAKAVSEKPIPSHLPIALEDPLPYLQAFSSLSYNSNIILLPPTISASDSSFQDEPQPIMQKHIITASHHSGFFSSRFQMIVNSSLLSVESIDVLRLDMNAEIELGTFIRSRATGKGALGKDIPVICWAMSRWIEVSIQRARFWCDVNAEFGTPEARAKATRKKKKRKRQAIDDDEEQEDGKTIWTRRQLMPNIGRTSFELSNEDVELRFEWKIEFDYTGEVESTLSANARMPRECK